MQDRVFVMIDYLASMELENHRQLQEYIWTACPVNILVLVATTPNT
jgi:diphthamide synthase subunit DPH2